MAEEVQNTELKPALKFSPIDRIRTFCQIMRHKDAPVNFNSQVLQRLKIWKVLPEELDVTTIVGNYSEFTKIVMEAGEKAEGTPGFFKAFEKDPWNFDGAVEGEYGAEELRDKFPRALELQSMLDGTLRFLFRAQPAQEYLKLVEREDGTRYVLRVVDTKRNVEDINFDAAKTPAITPHFEAVKFADGKTGLLIQWVDGRLPATPEERAACITQAEGLLRVPVETYDFWPGNFRVDSSTGQLKVYYVDQDIPMAIAQKGYAEITEKAKLEFEQGKKKMS